MLYAALMLMATPPVNVAATPSAEDPVVCKRVRRTGTRFERRVCRTESQWAAITENSRGAYEQVRDRPTICSGSSGSGGPAGPC